MTMYPSPAHTEVKLNEAHSHYIMMHAYRHNRARKGGAPTIIGMHHILTYRFTK